MEQKEIKIFQKEIEKVIKKYWKDFSELKSERDSILKDFEDQLNKRKSELKKET